LSSNKEIHTKVEAESQKANSARIVSEPKPQINSITDDQVIIRDRVDRLKKDWRGSNLGIAFSTSK
jgi:hypothetical protein